MRRYTTHEAHNGSAANGHQGHRERLTDVTRLWSLPMDAHRHSCPDGYAADRWPCAGGWHVTRTFLPSAAGLDARSPPLGPLPFCSRLGDGERPGLHAWGRVVPPGQLAMRRKGWGFTHSSSGSAVLEGLHGAFAAVRAPRRAHLEPALRDLFDLLSLPLLLLVLVELVDPLDRDEEPDEEPLDRDDAMAPRAVPQLLVLQIYVK